MPSHPRGQSCVIYTRSIPAVLALLLFVATSCKSGFDTHYTGQRLSPVKKAQVVAQQPPNTRLIGEASFLSADGEDHRDAIKTAKRVGADYVVFNSEYKNTTLSTTVMPVTSPTTTTTTRTGTTTGAAYGSGGGTLYGQRSYSRSTTYGTETTYVPVTETQHWVQYTAQFYRSIMLDG